MNRKEYFERLRSLSGENDFVNLALKVFRFQSQHNKIYSEFIRSLNISPEKIKNIFEIPFLPVEIFKSKVILTGDENYETIFMSSGTTGEIPGRHFIKDTFFYEQVFTEIFTSFYGTLSDFTILALLPSYLERENSSLVYMMDRLIKKSGSAESGFYLDDLDKLYSVLKQLQKQKKKTLLFGVTFALLDFVSTFKLNFPGLIVMETGGMKGREKEIIREEVHDLLCRGFGVETIHSEYGMTELLSQAYSKGKGIFKSPPWMRILIRDPLDPLNAVAINSSGGINIIDLANIDSCSFLATQDLGKVHGDNSFEVTGRFDFSDVRGCNLMVE